MGVEVKPWVERGFGGELVRVSRHDDAGDSPGKRAIDPGWQEAEVTPERLCEWSLSEPTNLGVRCRRYPAVDIDVDDPKVVAAISKVVEDALGPTATRVRANSPRKVYLYRLEGEPFGKKKIKFTLPGGGLNLDGRLPAVEILGDGQQVVIHGTHHTGATLEWTPSEPRADSLATMTASGRDAFLAGLVPALVRLGCTITTTPRPKNGETTPAGWQVVNPFATDGDLELARQAFDRLDPDADYQEWVGHGMELHSRFPGPEGLALFDSWSRRGSKYVEGEPAEKWATFKADGGLGFGSLLKAAGVSGAGGTLAVAAHEPRKAPARLTRSYAAAVAALRNPEIRARTLGPGALEFNQMGDSPTLARRRVEEHEVSIARERLEVEGVGRFGLDDLRLALVQVSRERSFHPVRDYLDGLAWDGTPRLADVAPYILGSRDALAPTLVRRWLVAAVARAYTPGCKVDSVLILAGRQGAQKSRFFSTLAGPDLFGDTSLDLDSKDALLAMHRVWIWELAELASVKRAFTRERVKSMITSAADTFRRPYAHEAQIVPRGFVLAGSTNEVDILTDPSGGRRFWIISTCDRIDLGLLADNRDQLWAEAVHLYRAGEQWHLTAEEEGQLELAAEEFNEVDAWTEQVVAFARERAEVTVADVLQEIHREVATGAGGQVFERSGPAARWTKADQMRVGDILRREGFSRGRAWRNGIRVRTWKAPADLAPPGPPRSGEVVPPETPSQRALPAVGPTWTTSTVYGSKERDEERGEAAEGERENSALSKSGGRAGPGGPPRALDAPLQGGAGDPRRNIARAAEILDAEVVSERWLGDEGAKP
jgi:hypothetical protein